MSTYDGSRRLNTTLVTLAPWSAEAAHPGTVYMYMTHSRASVLRATSTSILNGFILAETIRYECFC